MLCILLLCIVMYYLFFFFFKQKTAYEMRISDWSSDVCSSDLVLPAGVGCPVFFQGFDLLFARHVNRSSQVKRNGCSSPGTGLRRGFESLSRSARRTSGGAIIAATFLH